MDWTAINNVLELERRAEEAYALGRDDFLNGPFQRFLELCSNETASRGRARIMESARMFFLRYCEAQSGRGVDEEELKRVGRRVVLDWFHRPGECDDGYMIEVFDGLSNHNWRCDPKLRASD